MSAAVVDQTAEPAEAPRLRRRRRVSPALWFVAPFGIAFALFFLVPIGYAVYQSLFKTTSSGLGLTAPTRSFVGLDNYGDALSSSDFRSSIGRVLVFGVIQVPIMIFAATVLALLLESGRTYFTRFFRVSYFLPYGVPGVIASLLWGFLYVPATSPIVDVLGHVGVHADFLSSSSILGSIVNIVTWEFAGYNMLILIAALQGIPGDLYEAARVDGAGPWRIAWHIKLPLLRPAIILSTVFTIIGTLQLFAEPLVLKPLTTAINSNYTPNLSAYNQAFSNDNYSLAAAQAVIVALIAFVLSFGFLRIVNRKGRRAW
ncbi:MAG TPA: sugar ABC transporter permease [Conexibacter sp.]|jgi:multiple sugar transport system permease protein